MAPLSSDSYRLAQALDRVVRRLSGTLVKIMPERDVYKLGPFGGMVLLAVSDHQPCPIGTLSAQLGRDHSQMTRVIRKMQSMDLVRVGPDESDGRVTIVSLTEEGERHAVRLRVAMSEAADGFAAQLTEQDRKMLVTLLERLASVPNDTTKSTKS
ncbi:MAG: MarR family transcriptional regulator [Pseudomonadota bacterium]